MLIIEILIEKTLQNESTLNLDNREQNNRFIFISFIFSIIVFNIKYSLLFSLILLL